MDLSGQSPVSVSYTHLDVYKRQALEAANSHGDLKIRVARHNLFYQHERTKQRPCLLYTSYTNSNQKFTIPNLLFIFFIFIEN